MGKGSIVFVVGFAVATHGCRDATFIGTEYTGDIPSGDTESGAQTETNVDTLTDMITDTDSTTDIGAETDTHTDTVSDTDTDSGSDSVDGCDIPADFRWTSSEPLIFPPSNGVSIKDPTVVFYGDKWLVYATAVADPLTMTYLSFSDWADAGKAEQTAVSVNANLSGYKAAPQLFYFSKDKLWYLIYQTQDPAYSTNTDPSNVATWSKATPLMTLPSIITDNDKQGIDYWVICDDTDCYLFFSALDDVLYRARTAKDDFPEGFDGTTEIVMQGEKFALYDACNVYKMAGTDRYLLLVSAIGSGVRYFRSWTADRLDGSFTPLADTESNAFASMTNVTGADWSTFGLSHGEMPRTNPDETMTIETCNMLYLYSGLFKEESTGTEYYTLALLTDAR